MLSNLVRVRVTAAYAFALFTIASALLILGPQTQNHVVRQLSTNLENLQQGRLATLVGSAFVTSEGYTYLLLPGLVCLLALAELIWRGRHLVQVFAIGHVGATLIVAASLAAAIKFGWLPISIARADDVGLSYGAIAVLGMLTAAIPQRWRAAWVSGWLTVALVIATTGSDFTAVGHAVALVLGMLLSVRLTAHVRWGVRRLLLLGVGIGFGLLLLVGVSLPMAPVAVPAGLAIAVVAAWVAWTLRQKPPTTSLRHSSPASTPENSSWEGDGRYRGRQGNLGHLGG